MVLLGVAILITGAAVIVVGVLGTICAALLSSQISQEEEVVHDREKEL